MQLVLSNNRIIAHGENFLAMGGVVINTETGAKYENATVAECDGCPSDIDTVGYEYHGGVFVPCAPFGTGNNNGYFMEVCETCATPRNSGIKILGGLGYDNFNSNIKNLLSTSRITKLWSNASPSSAFEGQAVTLASSNWTLLIIEQSGGISTVITSGSLEIREITSDVTGVKAYVRTATVTSKTKITFDDGSSSSRCIPLNIYGVKV